MTPRPAKKGRKKPVPLEESALLEYAAKVLSARSQTIAELRTKLRRRAAWREDVERVIGRLKEIGFLSDQRFAESFAASRRDNQGIGKIRAVRDMLARRVPAGIASRAAEAAYRDADEPSMIERYLERKYRGKNLRDLLADEKRMAAAYRRLRTAGFSSGNSIRILKRYAAEAEKLADLEDSALD